MTAQEEKWVLLHGHTAVGENMLVNTISRRPDLLCSPGACAYIGDHKLTEPHTYT